MNAASIGQKAIADLKLNSALRGLFAVPKIIRNSGQRNFPKLQNRITELEEVIADRREFFNDDVNTYNTRIGQIPRRLRRELLNMNRDRCSKSPTRIVSRLQ